MKRLMFQPEKPIRSETMSSETARGTDRAFIAFVCTGCNASDGVDVMEAVRAVIRNCPLGVLVESRCIVGGSPCAMLLGGEGVIAAVQPGSPDEMPVSHPRICGPFVTNADLMEFCFWLESGSWS
jgi:hypothetical protein